MHTGAALPGDGTSVNVKKGFHGRVLRRPRGNGRQVLATEFRSIPAAADTGGSAESDLSSLHDGRIVGDKVVAVLTVFRDD